MATPVPVQAQEIEDNEPPVNYDPRQSGLTIQQFAEKLAKLGKPGIEQEYKQIVMQTKPAKPAWDVFLANEDKNRYNDVCCFDKRRVILRHDRLDRPPGYIHANFVDGYKQKNAYICSQGPMKETFIDFWRMVWQENSLLVISLTKMVEGKVEKCGQYWPDCESKVIKYGNIRITTNQIRVATDGSYVRSFLTLENTRKKEDGTFHPKRGVLHLLYLQWPDFGTPRNSEHFLKFRDVMNENQQRMIETRRTAAVQETSQSTPATPAAPPTQPDVPAPIVVHCSAGVGRTGTLVALDICIKQLLDTGYMAVPDTLIKLRLQRYMAIQKAEQYTFLNLSLLEFALVNDLIDIQGIDLRGFIGEDTLKAVHREMETQQVQQAPSKESNKPAVPQQTSSSRPANPQEPPRNKVVKKLGDTMMTGYTKLSPYCVVPKSQGVAGPKVMKSIFGPQHPALKKAPDDRSKM